ncbi:tetratricopeptide repeat protein [bacterium]|nr:tetratricopeptide repeat protein [bacterium]
MIYWLAYCLLWNTILSFLPVPPENYYNYGNRMYAADEYQKAERAYKKALAKETLRAKAYYNAGNAAYQQEAYLSAIAYYEKALDLNPEDNDAWHNLELARKKTAKQDNNQEKTQKQKIPNLRLGNIQPKENPSLNVMSYKLTAITNAGADRILAQMREQARTTQNQQKSGFSQHQSTSEHDIFTQLPEEILETMREMTRGTYPFRPGALLRKKKKQSDQIDW